MSISSSIFVIQFHQKYPQIILNVVDTTDDTALSALSAQQCNFAIVTGPFEQTQFQADPLFYSRYSVIMNQQHPLANKRYKPLLISTDKPLSAKVVPIHVSEI